MIIVSGTKANGGQFEQSFSTTEEAQAWIDNHISKNTFGLPERWLPEYLEGAEQQQMELGETLYLHPAEYSYTIEEEDLEVVKARKLEELQEASSNANYFFDRKYVHRLYNASYGRYDSNPSKKAQYAKEFNDLSDILVAEYDRCDALLQAATTEEEVNAITFNAPQKS